MGRETKDPRTKSLSLKPLFFIKNPRSIYHAIMPQTDRLFSSFSFLRHLSTKQNASRSLSKLKNINNRYRSRALCAARLALIEYLHFTRNLPFSFSEQIASNSPFSLSSFLSHAPFPSDSTPSSFPSFIRRFLSYHPIDEFDFFSESIGTHVGSNSLFLSDNPRLVNSVLKLFRFGFPFPKLGLLHDVFQEDADELTKRLSAFEELGFRRICVIGACLAFPWTLKPNMERKAGLLFDDLKVLLQDCESDDADFVFELCRKFRLFYDSGVEIGRMGEIMLKNYHFFLEVEEEVLKWNLRFFVKLGVRKEDMEKFVLNHMDILNIQLERLEIVVPDVLVRFLDLDEDQVDKLRKMYPHVMGKNKLGNLLGILKALDLDRRFNDGSVKIDFHCLKVLGNEFNSNSCTDNDRTEVEYLEVKEGIKSNLMIQRFDNKLEFLSSVGFGRNKIAAKIALALYCTRDRWQERFDCLIGYGIEYVDVCRLISTNPKLLYQSIDQIVEKMNYTFHDMDFQSDCSKNYTSIKYKRIIEHFDKLGFLFSIGLEGNKITSNLALKLQGTRHELQEKFDCLIGFQIKHDDFRRMISATPKLFNQSAEQIHDKMDFLCNELGYPIDYLNNFPAYLCFDLENTIKPRYKVMNWLKEKGLVKKEISPARLLSNDEKWLINYLYDIHPAAPKQWIETFSSKNRHRG